MLGPSATTCGTYKFHEKIGPCFFDQHLLPSLACSSSGGNLSKMQSATTSNPHLKGQLLLFREHQSLLHEPQNEHQRTSEASRTHHARNEYIPMSPSTLSLLPLLSPSQSSTLPPRKP